MVTEHGVVVTRSDWVASLLRSRLTHRRPGPAREYGDAGAGSGADVDESFPVAILIGCAADYRNDPGSNSVGGELNWGCGYSGIKA